MIAVSEAYKSIPKEDCIYYANVKAQLADSTILTIDDDTIMSGGLTIETATSQTDSFEVGSMVIGKLTLRITNAEDEYTPYNFEGAVIKPKIGLDLMDGTVEWLDKGVFTSERAATSGSVWTITAYDNMAKFDEPYSKSTLSYPATIRQIVNDACNVCGVVPSSEVFLNEEMSIIERPTGDDLTFRAVLSYVAQMTGNYGYCDTQGRFTFGWYDVDSLRRYGYDGGRFDNYDISTYTTGDDLDGGNFLDYNSGDNYDEGTFEQWDEWHSIYDVVSLEPELWNVQITGVKVKATGIFTLLTSDDEGNAEETEKEITEEVLYGKEGYVLTIDENPFITRSMKSKHEIAEKALRASIKIMITKIAKMVGDRVVGIRFRPLSTTVQSDPCIEAGDLATVTDYRGLTYKTVLTNVTYTLGGNSSYSCGAVSVAEQSTQRPSETAIKIEQVKQGTNAKIQNQKTEMQRMTGLIAKSMGIFQTAVQQEDGSAIFYMHDKPKLEESQTLWRMSAGVFSVSTDGGRTWNAGIDADGNAVVNMLSAIGINFDWARGGQLTLGGRSNANGTFRLLANDDTEMIHMDYDGIKLANGASLMSANGVCGNLQFMSSGGQPYPLGTFTMNHDFAIDGNLIIAAYIPKNYVVEEATMRVISSQGFWLPEGTQYTGYPRNIKLSKAGDTAVMGIAGSSSNYHVGTKGTWTQVVSGEFTSAGPNGVANGMKTVTSGDIKAHLATGTLNLFKVSAAAYANNTYTGYTYVGSGIAILDVIGYTKA